MSDIVGTFTQDADEKLDFTIDWTLWMATADVLNGSSWSVETFAGDASPLAAALSPSPSYDAGENKTTVWLEDGSNGKTYRVTNTVTTTGGRTGEKALLLKINDAPLAGLVAEDGTGLAAATSYATVAEADTFFSRRLYTTPWTGADQDDKERALIMASSLLDSHMTYQGMKTGDTQALSWPRYGIYDKSGFLVPSTTLPQALKDATSELAKWLLASDRTAEDDTKGFREMKVGSLELVVDRSDRTATIPDAVKRLLRPFGRIHTGMARVSR